ncbi:MAG: histidinol-phosphate transaminase [Thermodesulfovibrionales bacterium]|nr:histidinol-phosphate transaminase [Thermodesulfovibrionales bacterium]
MDRKYIASLIRKEILDLEGYRPEVIRARIKLDANECPYSPFRSLCFEGIELNRYPDPEAKKLRKELARLWAVKPENILHGNGSDELIYYLISVAGGPVLYPVPTFSMYGIIGRVLGQKTIEIALDENFDIPFEDFKNTIKKEKPGIIFLSSPNNPTGNSFSKDKILSIIKNSGSLVVIDEAYQPYAKNGNGFVPYTERYKNLLVMRTLSKIGLAGIRLGFVIGNREIISELNKARLPYNVNALTQNIAIQALKKREFFKAIIKKIVSEREWLIREMRKINQIMVYQSDANFILFRVDRAERIYRKLLQKGILIKNLTGVIPDCLRVTVGKPDENRAFLKALKEVL